jgi:hypothetical protein
VDCTDVFGGAMTVRCEGDRWIVEQVGEKQDFESELSRLGFTHEAFVLYVRRAGVGGIDRTWTSNYAVRVTHTQTGKSNIYWGGPRENWVEQFALDASNGLYGEPNVRYENPDRARSARNSRRSVV